MSLALRARVSWLMLSFSLFVYDMRSVASTVRSTESVCEATGTEQAHSFSPKLSRHSAAPGSH